MKDKINILWKFVTIIIRYKYLVIIVGFIVWVTFLDSYNLVDRYKNLQKLHALKEEANFFKNEIIIYETQYQELFSDKAGLEKFAREQYLMKEKDEDLFIVLTE